MNYILKTTNYTLSEIWEILSMKIEIPEKIINNLEITRYKVENIIKKNIIYGINTGFGSLCNSKIDIDKMEQLQINLLKSHACGTGKIIDNRIIKLMLILKIISLSRGNSGISIDLLKRLTLFYNYNILPIVYEYGSLGASGDLVPLSHLSLPLTGHGEVMYEGKQMKISDVPIKLEPLILKAKEGLALINGTQYILASSVHAFYKMEHIIKMSDLISCISIDAFDGIKHAFDMRIHKLRPYIGQIKTAEYINDILKESKIYHNIKSHVQDPYSFRCIPQVHGATKNAFEHFHNTLEIEINSITDNPLIVDGKINEVDILSGGNFHAQHLALVIDYMSIAISELANISERRIFQLISGVRDLPPYLISNSGLNSGFMIIQYTAASLVSLNKQLSTPSSVDSIVTSNGQEDHVSMGANAVIKLLKIIENVETVLALEMFTAFQALEFRIKKNKMDTSPKIKILMDKFRKEVPFIENDEYMKKYMDHSFKFFENAEI